MPLADRTPENKSSGSRCSVGQLLDEIDEDDRAVLQQWLVPDSGHTSEAIFERLKDEYNDRHAGHEDGEPCTDRCLPDLITWGDTPIGRHRRGGCKCDK